MTPFLSGLRAVAAFWIDFVLGDDWTVAATVAAALLGTAWLVGAGRPAWWLLPLAVIAVTSWSLRRAVANERTAPPLDPGTEAT